MPSLTTTTRLKPMPRMTGLEMPPPVVISLTPGSAAMALMMFPPARAARSAGRTTETGAGISFIFVSPARPVTTVSSSSKCLKNTSVESGWLSWAVASGRERNTIGRTTDSSQAANMRLFKDIAGAKIRIIPYL